MPTNAESKPDKSSSRGVLNVLRALGKTLVAASAVFYAVGFVVANFNLLRYGIYEFSLIKSKYIAAGALYFVIITIGSLPVWTLGIGLNPPSAVAVRKFLIDAINDLDPQMSFEEMKERVLSEAAIYRMHSMPLRLWNVYVDSKVLREWEPALDIPPKAAMVEFLLHKVGPRYRRHIVGSIIVSIVLMIPEIWFLNRVVAGMPFMGGNSWWQAAKISFPVWILFVLLLIVRIAQGLTIEIKGLHGTPLVSEWASKFLAILAVILSLVGFTERFYRSVPQGFGGGKPIPIQLKIEEDKSAQLQELVVFNTNTLTDPVLLLEETNNAYIILSDLYPSGEPVPVRIDKELVNIAVYPRSATDPIKPISPILTPTPTTP